MGTSATIEPRVDVQQLSRQLNLPADSVQNAVELLDDGNTVPFITRYRKDRTGGLDEQAILAVKEALEKQRQLEQRKETILRSIRSQDRLTDPLQQRILSADSMKLLEDLYLPYKPKKRTLATLARERGLEGLADEVLQADPAAADLQQRAAAWVDPDKQLRTTADVLAGVRHLLAERFSERSRSARKAAQRGAEDGQDFEPAYATDELADLESDAASEASAAVEHPSVQESAQPQIAAQSGGSRTEPAAGGDPAGSLPHDGPPACETAGAMSPEPTADHPTGEGASTAAGQPAPAAAHEPAPSTTRRSSRQWWMRRPSTRLWASRTARQDPTRFSHPIGKAIQRSSSLSVSRGLTHRHTTRTRRPCRPRWRRRLLRQFSRRPPNRLSCRPL